MFTGQRRWAYNWFLKMKNKSRKSCFCLTCFETVRPSDQNKNPTNKKNQNKPLVCNSTFEWSPPTAKPSVLIQNNWKFQFETRKQIRPLAVSWSHSSLEKLKRFKLKWFQMKLVISNYQKANFFNCFKSMNWNLFTHPLIAHNCAWHRHNARLSNPLWPANDCATITVQSL